MRRCGGAFKLRNSVPRKQTGTDDFRDRLFVYMVCMALIMLRSSALCFKILLSVSVGGMGVHNSSLYMRSPLTS